MSAPRRAVPRWLARLAPQLVLVYSVLWLVSLALGREIPWWDQVWAPVIMILGSFVTWFQQRTINLQRVTIDLLRGTINAQIDHIARWRRVAGDGHARDLPPGGPDE